MRVKEVTISDTERFVICHNPDAAERDAHVRAQLLTQLGELIADKRSEDGDLRPQLCLPSAHGVTKSSFAPHGGVVTEIETASPAGCCSASRCVADDPPDAAAVTQPPFANLAVREHDATVTCRPRISWWRP